MKTDILYIFIGGGAGSVVRYALQVWLHERITPYHFPWSTLTVNIAGSLIIGLCYALSSHLNLSSETRLLLTTGFCGGFTTFSTFSYDGLLLLKQGHYSSFILYIVLSLILGLGAAFLGTFLGENHFFLRKT